MPPVIAVEELQSDLEYGDPLGGERKQSALDLEHARGALPVDAASTQITQKASTGSCDRQHLLNLRRLRGKHGRWLVPLLPDVQGCLDPDGVDAPDEEALCKRITGTIDSQIRLGIDDDPCVVRGCPTRR
jgi:hypothetical protein